MSVRFPGQPGRAGLRSGFPPDVDPLQPSTGGAYAIIGGFWPDIPPGTAPTDALFASGFE